MAFPCPRLSVGGIEPFRSTGRGCRIPRHTSKPVANLDLWTVLINRIEAGGGAVEFIWVKGHAGDRMNELVDRLANGRARREQAQVGLYS
jgi:ribonuclease HI